MEAATAGQTCASCGALFPRGALVCPSCQKLVHTDELQQLRQEAEAAERSGDVLAELSAWRRALALLPSHSRQHKAVDEKVQRLTKLAENAPEGPSAPTSAWKKGAGGLTALGLLLWKLKAFVVFGLTKLKFLLLGLTKAQTLLSMLFAMGVYFTLWGWKFAVGFVLCMYVHEMGHVASMRRHGITASAPMFVPGFGAFVRAAQYPRTPAENARVGLAGPIWGLGAAVVCALVFFATNVPIWGALAKTGAYLNLFNLLPIMGLDGAHGFGALAKRERIYVVAAFVLAWVLTHEGLLILLGLVAAYRAFATPAIEESDRRTFYEFVGLIAALTALMHMHVPV